MMKKCILYLTHKILQVLLLFSAKEAYIVDKIRREEGIIRIDRRSLLRTTKRRLSKKQCSQIKSFWSPYYRIRLFAHEFYYEKTGQFSPWFIPDSIYFFYIDFFFNNFKMAKYLDNKCFYPSMFEGIKMPKMLAYRENGYWYSEKELIDKNAAINLMMNSDEIFIKVATESFGGKGVTYFKPTTENKDKLNNILSEITTDVVVQEGLHQSSIMASLNPQSVNTIRLLSLLRKDGEVRVYSSIVRMGVGDTKVDNASSGGITCGVNIDGRLKPYAFSPLGVKYDVHPTSNIHFDEIVIPRFEEILLIVKKLHKQVPHFRMVSWDVAIDNENDPVLIEANLCQGELDFHQLCNGPLFGSDTEEILLEVFQKNQH